MSDGDILLVGAGGHARACVDVIETQGRYRIAAFTGAADEVGREILGITVAATDDRLAQLRPGVSRALVTVGQIKSPDVRIRLFDLLQQLGFELPVIVSPLAHVSRHAKIGAGTIVMHGAIVNAGATVGRNCIVNSRSLIEHDAVVEDHCHVSTAAVLNGGVRVGRGTFVGSGVCVRELVQIGQRCVIGMGHTVLRDCADGIWLRGVRDNA